jgi:hypothetical protein
MTDHRSPPPEAEVCLCRRYPSSQKGGTLVVAGVIDFEDHNRRLESGRYRPASCPRCGGFLQVHGRRRRVLLADPIGSTEVARFRCSERACRAVWQVLPEFIARHLWRAWRTVERVLLGSPSPADASTDSVPRWTVRRWRKRAASSARAVIAVLETAALEKFKSLMNALGPEPTRLKLIATHSTHSHARVGDRLAELAEQIHLFGPGARIM